MKKIKVFTPLIKRRKLTTSKTGKILENQNLKQKVIL
jgi:hypothetical protein